VVGARSSRLILPEVPRAKTNRLDCGGGPDHLLDAHFDRGSNDPRVATEGTIAFLITLDNGFRIMFRDSGGVITDYENAAMQRIGCVDVALIAVSATYLHTLTAQRALEQMPAYKPNV
jgi:hypothetical protein